MVYGLGLWHVNYQWTYKTVFVYFGKYKICFLQKMKKFDKIIVFAFSNMRN